MSKTMISCCCFVVVTKRQWLSEVCEAAIVQLLQAATEDMK